MSQLHELALRIVTGEQLADKLVRLPRAPHDRAPGPPLRLLQPGRPPELAIARAPRVPEAPGLADPAQRPRILHAAANHELQAVELFAWALLAFPDAPAEFRQGLARVLREEQSHVRAYAGRLDELGCAFGALPVSGYFWRRIADVHTPAEFCCLMGLTFEHANLDHSLAYAGAARAAGDLRSAAVFQQVHDDEVGHVRFAARWLRHWARVDQALYDAYAERLRWPVRPEMARGQGALDRQGRVEAGLDAAFIERIAGGDPRG